MWATETAGWTRKFGVGTLVLGPPATQETPARTLKRGLDTLGSKGSKESPVGTWERRSDT